MPRMLKAAIALALSIALSGCVSSVLDVDTRGTQPIPAALVAQMSQKQMTPKSPVLVRIFKQESELEIWKQDRNGRYALLKTYPMCRWSGQLGPKTRAGDRQAPEGFYHVSANMLNPRSQYHLAFNLGYPNQLEAARGYTGEALMVHGACSSSGCYAMTDEGVGEIYAVVRDALKGGQSAFQVQAFPFRMTPRNMAKHRNNQNFAFWQDLKRGYDIFEVTRRQPRVGYCEGRYVFDTDIQSTDPLAACPMTAAEPAIASRSEAERMQMEALLTSGMSFREHAYLDGGMHPVFRAMLARSGEKTMARRTSNDRVPVSRPDAALKDPHSPSE
ncbi:hypothetical protein [Aliihoeflea aestuarii]|jgi:murein L,D-transpeptidase YafK|uniref:hypothetical protein n=1 Tax=Aliihoeflea aestuarii TaxID=453840 RepID=UPI003558C2DE